MGTVKSGRVIDEQKEAVKRFCDDIYTELTGMRMRILVMVDEMQMEYGEELAPLKSFKDHLLQLADHIEWRVQILSHACPYDWKGSTEKVESMVSVPETDTRSEPDFSGGYVGG